MFWCWNIRFIIIICTPLSFLFYQSISWIEVFSNPPFSFSINITFFRIRRTLLFIINYLLTSYFISFQSIINSFRQSFSFWR
ncbi:hypothetical protein Hanom_Chr17g01525101 [Helianthus anomalus]